MLIHKYSNKLKQDIPVSETSILKGYDNNVRSTEVE